MTVAANGFSIRDYTAKMRAVDLIKCWPFSAAIEIQQVEALLPPITITKFRWWSHELHQIQEQQGGRIPGNQAKQVGENLEIVCPVCGNFLAANKKVAHSHVETCLARSEREERRKIRMQKSKSKSKLTKKRSIVEIFAVSPLIEKPVDEEEEDHKKKKMKRNTNNNKMKKNKLKMMKKKTKKKNKSMISNKKGNVCKFKPSTPVEEDCSMHLSAPSCNKGIVENNMDGFSLYKNKSRLKKHCTKKQHGESKCIVKQQKALAPVRGILKHKQKLIPPMAGSSQAHFDKHVRFSSKDETPDQRMKNRNSSEEIVFSKYLNRLASQYNSEESDEEETVDASIYESVDAYLSSRNGGELQTNNKQLPATHNPIDMLDFLRLHQENEEQVSDKSPPNRGTIYENNLPIFAQGCLNVPNNPMDAGFSRLVPTVREACPNLHSQCAKISMASNSRGKSDYLANQTRGFASRGALASTSAKRNSSFMNESSYKSIGERTFPYQPYCHVSSPELMQGVGGLSERCTDGEFYGLPLNSHGELVRWSSGGSDQLKMSSSCNSLLSRSFPEKHPTWRDVPKGKSNFPTMHKNHHMHLPARFGVNELSDVGIVDDTHLLNSPGGSYPSSSYSLDSISFNQLGQKQYDQIPNCQGVHTTHLNGSLGNISLKTAAPTMMRLMGKDVAIGRSDVEEQAFEGGNFWIGKGHCPITNAWDGALPDMLPPSWEIDRNQAFPNNFQMKLQEPPRSSHPYFDWKTNPSLAMDRNDGYQRKANYLQESFIPSPEIHPSMKWRLPIDLSFLHREHVSFPSTYENLPPWLVDSRIQGPHVGSSALFVQPPIFPFTSNPPMINGNRINGADRMKFGFDVEKIKKRPAVDMSSDMLRPKKMPNLIHENLSGGEVCENIGECELGFNWEEGIGVRKDGVGTSNGIGFSEADETGPVKLSAGEKNIPKPSWKRVEDNSRAKVIHYSIPFSR